MPETTDAPSSSKRLPSLDAYRGFTMLLMASGGLVSRKVAEKFPDSQVWETLDSNRVMSNGSVARSGT